MTRLVPALLLLSLSIALSVVGRQLIVSKEGLGTYRSVQAALNEAQAGDTVLVNPGVYEETIEFVNGVTVIGSGAEHTILRYGYGFDEVLHAKNIVSGRIERVTIERMPSVLDAPAVRLDSAAMTFSECVITGGTPAGLHIVGLAARAILEDCDLLANERYGIVCEDGAVVDLVGGTVRDNGTVGIYATNCDLAITRTRIEANATTGLVLDGTARAAIDSATIAGHPAWGIDCGEESTVALTACLLLAGNGAGGLRLRQSATASVRDGRVADGAVGIDVEDQAWLELAGTTISGTTEAGLRLSDAAAARVERIEVVECFGDGCRLESTGVTELRNTTIVANGGDGISITGSAVAVTNSIVVSNGGAGLRVSSEAAAASPPTFEHNTVWGNAGSDYVGVARRSSDLAAYPEFLDASNGDYRLRLDSPCVGAGTDGTTVGASIDPTRAAGTIASLSVRGEDTPWGLDIVGDLRLASSEPWLDEVHLRVGRRWSRASFSIESSFLGPGSESLRFDGTIRPVDVRLDGARGPIDVRATVGAERVFDGIGSRSAEWVRAEVTSDDVVLVLGADWERSSGISRQSLALTLGGISFSAAATDLTLHTLDLSLDGALARSTGTLEAALGLAMLPAVRASATATWRTEASSLGARLRAAVQDPTSGDLRVTWADIAHGSEIDVTVEVVELAVRDVALRAATQLGDLTIESEVGIHTTLGVRLRVSVVLDTARWFAPQVNEPPVPSFESSPEEPEAGEPIAFDASATTDPDGEVVEFWWDFGDGTVDLGPSVSHTYSVAGEYTVSLTVSDEDGDTATLLRTVAVLEAATTPVASFTWAPVSESGTDLMRPLRAGDLVLLDAMSSYDPDGSIEEYGWDIESDGIFDVVTTEPRVTIDPLPAGTWPVTLRVVDDAGHTDAIMRVLRVEEPKPPEAAFDISPVAPSIYDPVRFLDRSFGGDGAIVAWEWAFGDGHVSREPQPVHRYEEIGQYEVRLTITDALGLSATHAVLLDVQRTPGVVPVANVWALVIGISDYEEVEDLPFARRDAEAIVDWLLENDVPPDRIRLLTDGVSEHDTGLPAAPASLVNVREALGWLRRVASEDDLVLIHFSGHGYQGADDGNDEADGVDEFFVLHDTRAAAQDDTALRDDEFGRFLDRIASNHVLIFFDSCYSGGLSRSLPPGRRASGEDADWFGDLRLEGRLLLAAASEGEEAFESPALEHGVFTHFLLEGLNGAADLNGDYHVTVWELFEHVASRVPDFVAAERGESQHPQMLGEGEARIVLSIAQRPLEASFSYEPAVPYVGGPVRLADESTGSDLVERRWRFDDEATAVGEHVEHVFESEGDHEVTLTVSDADGTPAEARLVIPVAPAGVILGADESGRFIISLGLRNGIQLGDRFSPDVAPDGPTLEVVELIDEDRALCLVVGEAPMPPDAVLSPDPSTSSVPPE